MSQSMHMRAGGYNYGSQSSGDSELRLDIAFPLGIIAMFFFCLVALLLTIQKRLQARLRTLTALP